MLTSGDFEGTGARDHGFVLNSVLDGSQTVADGIFGLCDRVVVGALDQDRAREGVLDSLNEGVLVVTEALLVDEPGEAKVGLLNVIDRVELPATTGKGDTLTIAALGSPDADDVVAGKDFQRGRVDALLVDDNEVLVSAVTETLLQLDNFHDAVVGELPL